MSRVGIAPRVSMNQLAQGARVASRRLLYRITPCRTASHGLTTYCEPAAFTVVVVCVCLCVCLSGHAILAVRAIKSIMKDTIVLSVRFAAMLKWRFS